MKKRLVVVKRSSDGTSAARNRSGSAPVAVVRYVECQKNHAAKVGGFAVDGCREFMARGEDGSEEALSCAACGCHRSFHRREQQVDDDIGEVVFEYSPPNY